MADPKLKKITEESHTSKKCPSCYAYIALDAQKCPHCKAKVGMVDKHGMASKRVDWRSYIICILAWIVLGVYVWFAFLR
jgi:hypothetical protein